MYMHVEFKKEKKLNTSAVFKDINLIGLVVQGHKHVGLNQPSAERFPSCSVEISAMKYETPSSYNYGHIVVGRYILSFY